MSNDVEVSDTNVADNWEDGDPEQAEKALEERFKKVKILQRAKNEKEAAIEKSKLSGENGEMKILGPDSTVVEGSEPQRKILLRRPKSNEHVQNKKDAEAKAAKKKEITLEERQAAYDEARNRILGANYKPDTNSPTTVSAVCRSKSPETIKLPRMPPPPMVGAMPPLHLPPPNVLQGMTNAVPIGMPPHIVQAHLLNLHQVSSPSATPISVSQHLTNNHMVSHHPSSTQTLVSQPNICAHPVYVASPHHQLIACTINQHHQNDQSIQLTLPDPGHFIQPNSLSHAHLTASQSSVADNIDQHDRHKQKLFESQFRQQLQQRPSFELHQQSKENCLQGLHVYVNSPVCPPPMPFVDTSVPPPTMGIQHVNTNQYYYGNEPAHAHSMPNMRAPQISYSAAASHSSHVTHASSGLAKPAPHLNTSNTVPYGCPPMALQQYMNAKNPLPVGTAAQQFTNPAGANRPT